MHLIAMAHFALQSFGKPRSETFCASKKGGWRGC